MHSVFKQRGGAGQSGGWLLLEFQRVQGALGIQVWRA